MSSNLQSINFQIIVLILIKKVTPCLSIKLDLYNCDFVCNYDELLNPIFFVYFKSYIIK